MVHAYRRIQVGDKFADLAFPEPVRYYKAGKVGPRTVTTADTAYPMTLNKENDLIVVVDETTEPLLKKVETAQKDLTEALEALFPYMERPREKVR